MEVEFSSEDQQRLVKLARHTSLVASRLEKAVTDMTKKLEGSGLIDPKRISKKDREKRLKKIRASFKNTEKEAVETSLEIQDHPSPTAVAGDILGDMDSQTTQKKSKHHRRSSQSQE